MAQASAIPKRGHSTEMADIAPRRVLRQEASVGHHFGKARMVCRTARGLTISETMCNSVPDPVNLGHATNHGSGPKGP